MGKVLLWSLVSYSLGDPKNRYRIYFCIKFCSNFNLTTASYFSFIFKLIRANLFYQLANKLVIYFLIFVATSYHEIQKDPGRSLKKQEDLERHRKTQVEVDRTNMIRQARRWYFKKTTVKQKWDQESEIIIKCLPQYFWLNYNLWNINV